MEKQLSIGGQALIEGVMMRSPHYYSVAIRKKNGKIVSELFDINSLTEKFKFLKWPFLRGIINFFEMLMIGIKSLNYSSDEFQETSSKEDKSSFLTFITIFTALGLGVLLFVVVPTVSLEIFIRE